jgi:hypothetical protein
MSALSANGKHNRDLEVARLTWQQYGIVNRYFPHRESGSKVKDGIRVGC